MTIDEALEDIDKFAFADVQKASDGWAIAAANLKLAREKERLAQIEYEDARKAENKARHAFYESVAEWRKGRHGLENGDE